jgi:hypothetical protein
VNPNSALIWLPKITDAGLPVPKTIIVPYVHHECLSIFDGQASSEFSRLSDAVMVAAKEIGFPVFIRTDLTSAKHSGPNAYKIDSDGHNGPIAETLEDTEMKMWLEPRGPEAFLVREFLVLNAPFTAFRDLPIAREFRFFADADGVKCWHPYWPPESIEEHRPSCDDWRSKLDAIQSNPPSDLFVMAVEAAKACGGRSWSVDFCQDVNGKWWLPDMATAADSFHWEGCPDA